MNEFIYPDGSKGWFELSIQPAPNGIFILSNVELSLAYDATIEGWSRALDRRDRDTEGHTRRLTEITLRLAQAMGIGDAELVHIHRGALLHDIGSNTLQNQNCV